VALLYSPKIGFDFLPLISELVEDVERDEQLLASAYAYRLIRTSIVMNFSLDAVNAIIGISEHLISNPTRDSAVLAYRAEIYSSIAVMLSGYGIKRTSYFYMEKAERVMKSIGDEKVRNIAKIGVWMYKAELYSLFSFSNISEAWNWAENALSLIEEVRKRINDYVSNEFVINHFKPYGGNAEERLKEGLDDCHGHAKCLIGRIYMVFDWLEEAEEVFKEALKYSMVFDEKLGIHGFIGTIKAIRDFQFEDFENLYKQMKMYKHRLSTLVIINTCAGYVLACLVSGKKVEKAEEVMEYLKTNLRVYALLLGVAHKLYGRFDHEEVLKALERLETEQRGSSQAILAKVLRMLIKNKRESAFEVARRTVYDIAQESLFIFSRLFAELADGIERGDEEETNKALVKLFYIHV
jgi:tetratricopeptide (TPR) repeat protein